jgi:alpha-N-arabinofuranosidase
MTGLERNAEVVNLCSYAPLFAHVDAWQWTPDLIWFDNLRSYATPNYHVQKLFSVNKGSEVVPLLMENTALTGQKGLYGSAVLDKASKEIVIKVVNSTDSKQTAQMNLEGVKKTSSEAKVTILRSDKKDAVNSIEQPFAVSPQEEKVSLKGKSLNLALAPLSLYVIRIKY